MSIANKMSIWRSAPCSVVVSTTAGKVGSMFKRRTKDEGITYYTLLRKVECQRGLPPLETLQTAICYPLWGTYRRIVVSSPFRSVCSSL